MPKKIIYADDAIDALRVFYADEYALVDSIEEQIEKLPSAEPQLDTCPIYGGMCGYPSNLCYECPRHEGAKERPQWWTEGLQPFAQPQRMKGRWIRSEESRFRPYMCSNCGALHDVDTVFGDVMWKFCPNCGSDNRGDNDGNE